MRLSGTSPVCGRSGSLCHPRSRKESQTKNEPWPMRAPRCWRTWRGWKALPPSGSHFPGRNRGRTLCSPASSQLYFNHTSADRHWRRGNIVHSGKIFPLKPKREAADRWFLPVPKRHTFQSSNGGSERFVCKSHDDFATHDFAKSVSALNPTRILAKSCVAKSLEAAVMSLFRLNIISNTADFWLSVVGAAGR